MLGWFFLRSKVGLASKILAPLLKIWPLILAFAAVAFLFWQVKSSQAMATSLEVQKARTEIKYSLEVVAREELERDNERKAAALREKQAQYEKISLTAQNYQKQLDEVLANDPQAPDYFGIRMPAGLHHILRKRTNSPRPQGDQTQTRRGGHYADAVAPDTWGFNPRSVQLVHGRARQD